jgi:hypothetical protein
MRHDNHSSLAPEEVNEELEEGVDSECLSKALVNMSSTNH